MTLNDKYILGGDDGRTPIPCEDVLTWGRWLEEHRDERFVANTVIDYRRKSLDPRWVLPPLEPWAEHPRKPWANLPKKPWA